MKMAEEYRFKAFLDNNGRVDERLDKKMNGKEKGLGMLIALLGAAMGQSVMSQYGVSGDASPKHVLNNDEVKYLLGIENFSDDIEERSNSGEV